MNFEFEPVMEQTIKLYLKGQLKGEALYQFERDMKQNPVLAQEVRFREQLIFLKQNEEFIRLNEKVSSIINTTKIQPDYSEASSSRWYQLGNSSKWIIGAIILTVLSTSLYYSLLTTSTITNQKLTQLQSFIKPFQNQIILDEDTSTLSLGLKAYDNQDYQKTVTYLNEYLIEFPYDKQVGFYLGVAYLKTNQAQKAIRYFENLIQPEQEDLLLADPSRYYAAIAYLSLNQPNRANTLLQKLSSDTISWMNLKELEEWSK